MTLPENEKLESLADIARASWMPRPRGGKPLHTATVSRWASHGVRGVLLEAVHVGTTVCSSKEAVLRFFDAVAVAKRQSRADRRATPNTARDSRRTTRGKATTRRTSTRPRKAAAV